MHCARLKEQGGSPSSPFTAKTQNCTKAPANRQASIKDQTRISEWTNMDGAKYTLLVEWKTNIVAKVNSYGNFGLGVEFGTWR